MGLPNYYDISSWDKRDDLHTQGTREKFVVHNSEGRSYYFKSSSISPNYPFEFWSEIVASQLGEMLYLPVLRYDIAIFNGKIGCLSESMNSEQNTLTSGYNYIKQFYPDFQQDYKKNHTIERIFGTLRKMHLDDYSINVIAMVLFDCIIGNTDRHSENWALLQYNHQIAEQWNDLMSELPWYEKLWINYWVIKKKTNYTSKQVRRLFAKSTYSFSPFFDNGSSLGRELTEERISKMLVNNSTFDSYFNNGYHDIKFRTKKTTFKDTIDILCCDYKSMFEKLLSKHIARYNEKVFSDIIFNIDSNCPTDFPNDLRLSNERREFIIKLVTARIGLIFETAKNHGISI